MEPDRSRSSIAEGIFEMESRPKKISELGDGGGRVFPQLEPNLGRLPNKFSWIWRLGGSWKCPRSGSDFMQDVFPLSTNHVDGHVPECTHLQGMDPPEFGALTNRPSSLLPEARLATVNWTENNASFSRTSPLYFPHSSKYTRTTHAYRFCR